MASKKADMPLWRKINKPLASLKLAVIVILGMGTMSAWGTIVESKYNDAKTAQELVYHSWYSYSIFLLLSVNLIAVMVDRWPWKKKHIGFICAHIGILILIAGSVVTRYWGVDGSMAIDIGSKNNQILIPAYTDLLVYSGLSSGGYRQIYNKEVNFLVDPPSEEKPFLLELPGAKIKIDHYNPYSLGESKVYASSESTDGPGLRFQLSNERVNETNWLLTEGKPMESLALGPAQVVLARKGFYNYTGGNILLVEFDGDSDELDYTIFTQRLKKKTGSGKIKAGQVVETGWMGLTFRLLKYLPHAQRALQFTPVSRAGDGIVPSLRLKFNGKTHWMALNSNLKFFTDSAVYYVTYANRLLPIDFEIALKDFKVGRYQGTRRAASYASDVFVLEKSGEKQGPIHIAMNEPLHHKGFTFYQASFSEDEGGQATTSVLSVNRDPGRPWKYLGSLMIVFGIIDLFYIRPRNKRQGTVSKKAS